MNFNILISINTSMSQVNASIPVNFKEKCQELGSLHIPSSLSPLLSSQRKSEGEGTWGDFLEDREIDNHKVQITQDP